MSAFVLEELNLFDLLYRFQRYRRLQIEAHSRSNMDLNSSLLHLNADVGWRWRKSRRQRSHAQTEVNFTTLFSKMMTINHYPINKRLMGWIQSKIPDVPITNFTNDWNDGRAVGALVDAVAPGNTAL